MTLRRQLIELLSDAPRSVSSIAREMGLGRGDAEEDLRHALRSAAAAGHRIEVIPAPTVISSGQIDSVLDVLPSMAALQGSYFALYEIFANIVRWTVTL